jgi:hypothetical protein
LHRELNGQAVALALRFRPGVIILSPLHQTVRGHCAWTVAPKSFAFPPPSFENLAVAEKDKITTATTANKIRSIIDPSICILSKKALHLHPHSSPYELRRLSAE